MASVVSRAITSFSKKAFSIAGKESKFCVLPGKIGAPIVRDNLRFLSTIKRNFALENNAALCSNAPILSMMKSGYASLHTEGDRRFAELLEQEIAEEKKRSMELPRMSDGWKLKLNGAEGVLSKNQEGDQIEVSFTLNGSVPPLSEEEGEEMEGEDDITSFPDFTVKVSKSGTAKKVEFECYFPEDVALQTQDADESMGMFSIRSAIVYEGEVTDETYIIDTENLDPDVYSYFLSYLADRSVDDQFAREFVELTTAAEHEEYVRSLQKLKSFISTK